VNSLLIYEIIQKKLDKSSTPKTQSGQLPRTMAGEREKRRPRGSVQFTAFVKKAGITGDFEPFLRV
jgi:hypothetical protein